MSGLKVSSLVRKFVFYRPELTGKWIPHGTEIKFLKFKNILTDRAQRVDEKNGVIHLFMFTPRVMVIKISKKAHFMYFLLDTAKYQSQFGQDISIHLKGLIGPFRKYYGLCISELPLANF